MFDEMFHKVFNADVLYRNAPIEDVYCGKCGNPLTSYYCESELHAVKCDCCKTITLVEAKSPAKAMMACGGYRKKKIEYVYLVAYLISDGASRIDGDIKITASGKLRYDDLVNTRKIIADSYGISNATVIIGNIILLEENEVKEGEE